jgi:precorrin-8X/cobalt-precorrin-8 methylmutase
MEQTGVIVLIAGSREEQAVTELPETLRRITQGLKCILPQGIKIESAVLQFNHPSIEDAAKSLISQAVNHIVIAPYFLFSGVYNSKDILETVAKLKRNFPDVCFIVAGHLGMHESLVDLLSQRIIEACPSMVPSSIVCSPAEIEAQSMKIIENLLPQDLQGDQRTIVKRIVHACGDSSIAHLVRFSASAVEDGLSAIKEGCSVITDVRMVMNGISRRLLEKHHCSLICALDASSPSLVADTSGTRSAKSIYNMRSQISSSLMVIGNAPTSLLALINLIDNEKIIPSLVIGMPVGFVQAKESKDQLMRRDVPFITIEGNRGGSSLAAATINALLRLAENSSGCKV